MSKCREEFHELDELRSALDTATQQAETRRLALDASVSSSCVLAADLAKEREKVAQLERERDDAYAAIDISHQQLAAAQADAARYRWLREACGYVQDGSSTSVTISQDDASHEWVVRVGDVGSRHWWHGKSLGEAIDAAHRARKEGK